METGEASGKSTTEKLGRRRNRKSLKNEKRLQFLSFPLLLNNHKAALAISLIAVDAILTSLIIAYVPYTKIDWDAYMSQVSGFLGGERNYANLKGDTGPLVYPAGFLYIYSAIQYVTDGQVYSAQILFGILYVVNLSIVFFLYLKSNKVPWWVLVLLCLSKRVHSIFVLRLFNDCLAMAFLHSALALFVYQKWHLGMILFSVAVSVKMNVLLYAPPLFLLLLKAMDIKRVLSALCVAALVQIVLGLPFLITYPVSYISRAFNLGRVFIHFWSVNFKFVPESIFVSKQFALSLLAAHLGLLAIFAHYKWCKFNGGIFKLLRSNTHKTLNSPINEEHILSTMFTGNFIGIVCARSLHYQFYSWYFFSVPYLLYKTCYPTWMRLILFVGVEYCWNIFPSNEYSSSMLLCLHLILLWGLWSSPSDFPFGKDVSTHQN